jgi:hypothetical protein
MPWHADYARHGTQDVAGVLEIGKARPILRETIKQFGKKRIERCNNSISRILGIGPEFRGTLFMEIVKGFDGSSCARSPSLSPTPEIWSGFKMLRTTPYSLFGNSAP